MLALTMWKSHSPQLTRLGVQGPVGGGGGVSWTAMGVLPAWEAKRSVKCWQGLRAACGWTLSLTTEPSAPPTQNYVFSLLCRVGVKGGGVQGQRPGLAISTSSGNLHFSPECSLEGPMLKLKPQYFGHLMARANSLEKTLMLGKIRGGRRRR